MIASSRSKVAARAGSAAILMAAVLCVQPPDVARAQSQSKSAAPMEARISALIPDLEAYIQRGMKAYDVPGVAIGIVTGDRLVYAKGFGVRSKSGGAPVDPRHRLSDRLAHQGIPRRHHGHHGRSRQAQVG